MLGLVLDIDPVINRFLQGDLAFMPEAINLILGGCSIKNAPPFEEGADSKNGDPGGLSAPAAGTNNLTLGRGINELALPVVRAPERDGEVESGHFDTSP